MAEIKPENPILQAAPGNTAEKTVRNDPPPESPSKMKEWGKKITINFIALLLLQIPLGMVEDLTSQRQQKLENVTAEIYNSWGGKQTVSLLQKAETENISADITPELRNRGIYQVAVYTSKITIKAEYKNIAGDTITGISVSDIKDVISISAKVNGNPVNMDGLKFKLPAGNSSCEITLAIRGTETLQFAPNAGKSHISISGNWDSPGFCGAVLPEKRTVSDDKFSAEWNIGDFVENKGSIGVNLCIVAGSYQQVARCFNYATFFLIIFFFTLLAAELITKTHIHTLQYLVASGAPVLFYLMTLAFSERIGFTAGYIVSATVIVAMVTMYARMFLGKKTPALTIGAIFAASYLLNFVVLRMEDLALISGTIVLVLILGVLMILTGKINHRPTDAE